MIIHNTDLEKYMDFCEQMPDVINFCIDKMKTSVMYDTEYAYRCGVHDLKIRLLETLGVKEVKV